MTTSAAPFDFENDDVDNHRDTERVAGLLYEWFGDWRPPRGVESANDVDQWFVDAASDVVRTLVRIRWARERSNDTPSDPEAIYKSIFVTPE